MQDKITMTKFKASEGHSHPALDISWQENKRAIFDDHFEVSVEKLKDEI